jgi:PEP-CTERM motif
MKIQSIAAALALAAASSAAIAAGPGSLGTIDNMPVTISNIVPMGIFQNVYSFSIADPGSLSGNVVAINFGAYNILGLTVTLQDTSFAVIGSDNTPADGFSFGNLAAGNYALNVLGLAEGSQGGFYAGGMIAQTAPIPEPETYALMLAGLGIVGFIARRRRSAV